MLIWTYYKCDSIFMPFEKDSRDKFRFKEALIQANFKGKTTSVEQKSIFLLSEGQNFEKIFFVLNHFTITSRQEINSLGCPGVL